MCTCNQEVQFGAGLVSDDEVTICSSESEDDFSDCEYFCSDYEDCCSCYDHRESQCMCYEVLDVETCDCSIQPADAPIHEYIHIEQPQCIYTVEERVDGASARVKSKSRNKPKKARFCNRDMPTFLKESNFKIYTHSMVNGLKNMEIIVKPLKPKLAKAKPRTALPKLKIAVSKHK